MNTTRVVTISSATLFHFTDSQDHLENILANNFLPHYSLEIWSNVLPKMKKRAFPMVSFCDIPLSHTRAHMDYYGRYAIGLSKTWGRRNGVCPVTYAYQDAPTARLARRLFAKVFATGSGGTDEDVWNTVFRLLEFFKPYEGKLERKTRIYPAVRFYDEREWRFVPDIDDCEPHPYGMTEDEFRDGDTRRRANEAVQGRCALEFAPEDVKYLIVASESEILPFMRMVESLKGAKYSLDDVKKLTTRIISAGQIESDF